MRIKMSQILKVVVPVGLLLLAFQNCSSQVGFGTKSDSSVSKAGSLVALDINDDENVSPDDPSTTTDNSDDSAIDDSPEIIEDPVANDDTGETPDDSDGTESDSDLVICILNGPGKSLKLGYLSETSLGGVNAVAKAVCISENACLKEVSKKFDVKGAYERGFCGKNPNVKVLTDDEVKALLQ